MSLPPPGCEEPKMWPQWFFSDLAQSLIYLWLLIYVLRRYRHAILPSVVSKLKFYSFLLVLRPLWSYLLHLNILDLEITLTFVWLTDELCGCLFYFLVFNMAFIQITLETNSLDRQTVRAHVDKFFMKVRIFFLVFFSMNISITVMRTSIGRLVNSPHVKKILIAQIPFLILSFVAELWMRVYFYRTACGYA